MANDRTRKKYKFVAVSGTGKKQSAFGVFQPNADLDTRENCEVTIEDNVNRRIQRGCNKEDIEDEPILSRDTQITLNYTEGITAQQIARWEAYRLSVAGSASGSTADEVQTFTRSGTVSGGTFTLSYTHEGKTGTTEAIAYDATAAVIQAAMLKSRGTANAMGKLFKTGDVVVTGDWTGGIVFTFGGRFAGTNVAAPTIGNGSITGGGTVAVTQTTAGSQKSHALSRSTDSTMALFSLITGDENGAYDYIKYGNCAVESTTPNFSQEAGAYLGYTVVIYADYVPERESSYSVPACAIPTPLIKTEDCKVKIDGNFETPDVDTLNAFFRNNMSRTAAHGYDSIDITNAWQRGDEPDQEFSLSVYGTPEANVYTIAEAEETSGNEVEFILYLGNTGNRMEYAASNAKIKFQNNKTGEAGELRQETINIVATPHGSPPLTYTAYIPQSAAFLTASS